MKNWHFFYIICQCDKHFREVFCLFYRPLSTGFTYSETKLNNSRLYESHRKHTLIFQLYLIRLMKKLILILFFSTCAFLTRAAHITGGEMIYDFVSADATSKTYRITLLLFRDENCIDCAVMPTNVFIGIYNNDNNQLFGGTGGQNIYNINLDRIESLPLTGIPQCITNPPTLRYTVGFYIFTVTLPNNDRGYTAAYQTCCRIDNIMNIGNSVGATYTASIPGLSTLGAGLPDSSPRFVRQISVACFERPFTMDFSATDPDGDQLVYSMCSAYNGGNATNANNIVPGAPPYAPVIYTGGFSGNTPMGPLSTINTQTGIISGIAPQAGKYVISVCIDVVRNGTVITTHRKDFIVTIAPCDLPGAQLEPNYITCDGFNMSFSNLNNSPLNVTYEWNFGDPASGANNISNAENPTHTYSDTGIYLLKLVVNKGTQCSDSAVAQVKVYPGFFPGFTSNSPMCKGNPVQFNDTTVTRYGVADNWKWDFGDPSTLADTSRIKNPTYIYALSGTYRAKLIVSTSKGCTDTLFRDVVIVDKPEFSVGNDTLICSIDTLRLRAVSPNSGAITWRPNYNINNINSFTPLVSPDVTTTYIARFVDRFGCIAEDTIVVNVVDSVTLRLPTDTTICRTDAAVLNTVSDALQYIWSPAATLNNPNIKNPIATPTAEFTTYSVRANIGKCESRGSITVKTVPYPIARASNDTTVCFGSSIPLQASGGTSYVWSPPLYLNNAFIPNPVVQSPPGSITYIVAVRDTQGCPKPSRDTVFVTVRKVIADAGPRDTSVVIGQPLQLTATGGTIYQWAPVTQWLNNPSIANPVSLPQDNVEYIVHVSSDIGCSSTDTIMVKVFKVAPDMYVPTAFSPNGDGLNETLKPLALGLKSVDAFRIYNRWGQLLFQTRLIGVGWDGTFGGKEQAPGTYVWYAEGTDYLNRKIQRKGSVVLIR